jgi:hypothetical protein
LEQRSQILFNFQLGKRIHNTPNDFWEMKIKYQKFTHHKMHPHALIDGISCLNLTTNPPLTVLPPLVLREWIANQTCLQSTNFPQADTCDPTKGNINRDNNMFNQMKRLWLIWDTDFIQMEGFSGKMKSCAVLCKPISRGGQNLTSTHPDSISICS